MSLPQLSFHRFEVTLPSDGRKVILRPYLVKEEKILLMATESDSTQEYWNCIRELINNCSNGQIDAFLLPPFDVEYLFLKLRAKSVGESVEPSVECPKCKGKVPIVVNINEIEVVKNPAHQSLIELEKDVAIKLKYPTIEVYEKIQNSDSQKVGDVFQYLINSCIESIVTKDEVHVPGKDVSEKELTEFVESFNRNQFDKILTFFKTFPKLQKKVNCKCINPSCNHDFHLVLEGITNFFGYAPPTKLLSTTTD